MTPPSRRLQLAALLAVASGCRCAGGQGLDAGRDPAVPVEVDSGVDAGALDGGPNENEFCDALARVRCDREHRCLFLDGAQRPACLARLQAQCLAGSARVRAGVATFDPLAALACLDAGSPRCIAGPLAEASACALHQVFRAAGVLGAGCVDSQDCLAGFCFGTSRQCKTCRAWRGDGQGCNETDQRCDPASHFCSPSGPRTCKPRLEAGMPCSASSHCASGVCNYNGNVPDAGPDTCGRLSPGAACGDPGDCLPGSWCSGYAFDGVTVTPGVCSTRLAVGQPCSNQPDDDGCLEPATCIGGRCAAVAPYSLDAGSECEGLSQCSESSFCRGFESPAPDGGRSLRSGTCALRLSVGEPCSYARYVDTDCNETSTCGRNGQCVSRGGPDGGCLVRFECKEFLACPSSIERCTPFLELGQACDAPGVVCADGPTDALCSAGSAGSGAFCVPLLIDGTACQPVAPAECDSARCFASDGGAATCQPSCLP